MSLVSFFLRVGLFLLPVLSWPAIELFVLPIDFFTFRPWEAMIVKTYPNAVLGPFYPSQHLVKYSIGAYDNHNRVENPRRKLEEWFTDANGYRNRPRAAPPNGYDVFVSGNSDIVGAFNNQPDTLAETIERTCGLTSYNVGAGATTPLYLSDPILVDHPPRFFVYLVNMDPIPARTASHLFYFEGFKLREPTAWPVWAMVLWDRLQKQAAREWVRSRIAVTDIQRFVDHFFGTRYNLTAAADLPVDQAFDKTVERVGVMSRKLKALGSELVLLFQPVPKRIETYQPLIERLRAMGYKLAAWYPTDQWRDGVPDGYWHKEDSHWTEAAIRDVAGRLCSAMNGGSGIEPPAEPILSTTKN